MRHDPVLVLEELQRERECSAQVSFDNGKLGVPDEVDESLVSFSIE
jgi:hypothetical protein